MNTETFLAALKIITLSSVLFVWVVKYKYIRDEFKQYQLPEWLRDFVGILKISCVVMLFNPSNEVVVLGCVMLSLLMFFALLTHLKVKNPLPKMVPALSLLFITGLVLTFTLKSSKNSEVLGINLNKNFSQSIADK